MAVVTSWLYDIGFVAPLTAEIYRLEGVRLAGHFKAPFTLLDVGTANGTPLSILLSTPNLYLERATAIDIDEGYLQVARSKLAAHANVSVRQLDFMEAEQGLNGDSFDCILFGFSFMFMPNRVQALHISKKLLQPRGQVVLYLTLYRDKSSLMEYIKPKAKWLTSIDFGDAIYHDDLLADIDEAGWKINEMSRIQSRWNLAMQLFEVYKIILTPI